MGCSVGEEVLSVSVERFGQAKLVAEAEALASFGSPDRVRRDTSPGSELLLGQVGFRPSEGDGGRTGIGGRLHFRRTLQHEESAGNHSGEKRCNM
jgi:hypothetical protein